MAIQMRRGLLANYDEDKMVAGELAVTTDATTEDQQVYVAFAPGTSKRILTETDLETVESVRGMIAPDFDASITYASGDYVIYSGTLYQFTSNHTGAWTGADAEETTVAEDISQLKEDFRENGASNLLDFLPKNNGSGSGITYTWNGNRCTVVGTSTGTSFNNIFNNKQAFPEGVEPGEKYYIIPEGSSGKVNIAVYSWKGSSLTQLGIEPELTEITIPSDATGLLIRVLVWGNLTVNETVIPKFLTSITNKILDNTIKILSGTITPVAEKAMLNEGTVAATGYSDANDITRSGVCFCGSSGGQADIANTPFYPCWIYTITSDATHSSVVYQIAYPYYTNSNVSYRVKQAGTWTEWKALSGGTTTITQEVSRDTYNNTYDITTNPTITTGSNGWLQPIDVESQDETGKTDMTGAIMSMLNSTGYCHLAEGIYYVSGNIDIPTGATLEGCGRGTIIRLLGSVSSGYICRLKEYSTVKNIRFSGSYAQGDISDGNIGGRKGVVFIGNRNGQDSGITPSTTKCCQITGCWFENLDSGIYGYNAGGGLQEGMIVSDCYITRCKAGINLDYWVEYCKFTNIVTFQCYYACINNGGNNVFTACTFHGVVGFLIDNSSGAKDNNGHGSVIGCTFNHIDNINNPSQLGKGYGIKVLNTSVGFIFANCQLWYGRIHIENSKGIQITGCEMGGLGDSSYPIIESSGDNMIFVDNCLFNGTPYFSISSPSKFTNCWTYNGVAVTA